MIKIIEIKEQSLEKIFKAFLPIADMFSFTIREENENSKKTNQLLNDLSNYSIEKFIVREWPGSKLLLGTASLFNYFLNNETIYILKNYNNNIFDWTAPHLPEDLVIYKDDIPQLISITHEKDLYIQLNDNFDLKDIPESLLK